MTGLILTLILGTLVLLLAGRLVVQATTGSRNRPVTIDDYASARAALDSVFAETAAVKRIFAKEDMEFIAREGTREVQRFFLRERNKLAVQCLQTARGHVKRLMDLHLKLASYTYEPSPRIEFNLTVKYWLFILASNALLVLVRFRGPFQAVEIAGYALRVSEDFSTVFSLRLEKVDPEKLSPIQQPHPG
jgi:hypothetical protein